MLVKTYAAAVNGLQVNTVTVETSVETGQQLILTGLGDEAVRESQSRIRVALKYCNLRFPSRSITINLSPANLRKEGSGFDLPMAIALLAGDEKLPPDHLEEYMMMGELGLDGSLKPIIGALPIAIKAREEGFKGIILPKENSHEAAVVNNLDVYGMTSLTEVIQFLSGNDNGNGNDTLRYDTAQAPTIRPAGYDNDNGNGTSKPYVILVVGVNGVGKTTTIGKLAYKFKQAGKKVYLGAADTFRAAAVEQLVAWGERVGVPVVKQQMGSDPASVAYDTLASAKANGADVVIIDTAGRLHNKVNLMNELKKIKDVMKKVMPEAPDEVLLVLDGSTGQNAFEQARQFANVTQITSLAITKLDGTAKGGVVIGISDQLKVPVKYIGLGEGMEDLQEFDRREFVNSLFGE